MDPDYAGRYQYLYERHWWWRAREDILFQQVRSMCAPERPSRILDVGCGSGLFFDRLLDLGEVIGVEPDRKLAEASPRHRDRIHVGTLRTLPGDKPFDVVLMLDVLEHLVDPNVQLTDALARLRPGGKALVTVPAFPVLWTHHDVLNHHHRRYTRRTLVELVRLAGGHLHDIRYFFHWLFPVKLGVRLLEALGRAGASPGIPPAVLNRGLYRLSRLEERLLGRARLPFGTSLMAICS